MGLPTATNIASDHQRNVGSNLGGSKLLGIAVMSRQNPAACDHSEGCLGHEMAPLPRNMSCRHLAMSCHRENGTYDVAPDGIAEVLSHSCQNMTMHGDSEVVRRHKLEQIPCDTRCDKSAALCCDQSNKLKLPWL
mmetsp:Transcript_66170/g.130412  ORF Transcript_66170/g.130412 Transcript_66170/m.130412 type:complete len:135 (+) Transcript_66170:393-797(+)